MLHIVQCNVLQCWCCIVSKPTAPALSYDFLLLTLIFYCNFLLVFFVEVASLLVQYFGDKFLSLLFCRMCFWLCHDIRGANLCWALGGIICNFTPILPYFQHWGMNLDHDFFQVSKLSEKKGSSPEMEHFFSRIQLKTKKKRSSPEMEHFFPPNSDEDQKKGLKWNTFFPEFNWRPKKKGLHQRWNTFFHRKFRWKPFSNYSQIIGGIFPPPPPPPGFWHPCMILIVLSEKSGVHLHLFVKTSNLLQLLILIFWITIALILCLIKN